MVGLVLLTAAALTLVSLFSPDDPRVAGPLSFVAGGALFLGVVGGWLGDELGSGAALFWVQTPHPPLLVFGARFAGVALFAAFVGLVVPGATAGLLFLGGHGAAAHEVVRSLPGLAIVLGILAALVWGAGGWGVRGDTWAAPALAAAFSVLELVVSFAPSALGPLAGPADVAGLPLDAIRRVRLSLHGSGTDVRAVATLLAWTGAWCVWGAVGILVRVRRIRLFHRGG